MITDAPSSPTQFLPYDLERAIIEHAAYLDQRMALKLTGLSWEVKRWIEPILYRHIKLDTPSQADAFIHTLEFSKSKSSDFFPNTIKSISFTYGVTLHQAAKILFICKNITSLTSPIEFSSKTLDFTIDDVKDFGQFVMTPSPSLKRLSVTLRTLFFCPDPGFRAPILQNLTHLGIFGGSEHFQRWSWTGFDNLQHLTHFSFDIDTNTPLTSIYTLIPHFPSSLRVCLIIVSSRDPAAMPLDRYFTDNTEIPQLITGETDKRIVVGVAQNSFQDIVDSRSLIPVQQWNDDTFDDRWEKAEVVIRDRTSRLKRSE